MRYLSRVCLDASLGSSLWTTTHPKFAYAIHRSGLTATICFSRATFDGFYGLVDHLLEIMSWKTALDAGMDPSQSDTEVALPTAALYGIAEELCYRS